MRKLSVRASFALALAVCLTFGSRSAVDGVYAAAPPATAYWDGAHLASLRDRDWEKDSQYKEVAKRLRKNVQISLEREPYSVTFKDEAPPSGDKHDYLSFARYWWPNPDSTDGLPYIRRDGKTNDTLLAKGDRVPIGMLYDDVETLALAAYLCNDDEAARHAARLVRSWFLDSATRMNPHLRYGQAVPGRNDGRGSGIIDTRHFIRILDSVALLRKTDAWSDADHAALVLWMRDYLDWLRSDEKGKDEAGQANNHGTWYDAQVMAIAIFVGEDEFARQVAIAAKKNRIERCIEPDGQQPEELTRTKGLHYCVFNLSAMSVLARLAEHSEVDLWRYESEEGASLRRGLDFIMPYLTNQKAWPHSQIAELSISPTDMGLFYLAAQRYQQPEYLQGLKREVQKPAKFQYVNLQFASD